MDPTPESQIPEPPAEATPAQDEPGGERQESITRPAKLLRIASMVRELLEETRQTSLDEPWRIRLRQIYERSVASSKRRCPTT
jgi:hypothetical protein